MNQKHSTESKAFRRQQGIPQKAKHSAGSKAFHRKQSIPQEAKHSTGSKACLLQASRRPECDL
jgi:hypothetical protein